MIQRSFMSIGTALSLVIVLSPHFAVGLYNEILSNAIFSPKADLNQRLIQLAEAEKLHTQLLTAGRGQRKPPAGSIRTLPINYSKQEFTPDDCFRDLQSLFGNITNLGDGSSRAWQMVDGSGKLPDGLLQGALYSPGIVYECMSAPMPTSQSELKTGGTSYCLVQMTSDPSQGLNASIPTSFNLSSLFPSGTTLENAFCVPQTCSNPKENLEDVMARLTEDFGIVGVSIRAKRCLDDLDFNPELDAYQVVVFIVLAIFASLVIIGTTCLEVHKWNNLEDPMAKSASRGFQTLAAFSIVSNTSAMVNTKATKETITCLNGIRLFALFWVFFGHSMSNNFLSNIYNNPGYFIDFIRHWLYMTLYNGEAAVDTFFTMSGILVTYILLKEMDKNKGRFNVIHYYVHRYIRLTPLYAINIALLLAVFPLLSDSPRQHEDLGKDFLLEECKYWWSSLLYIHNLFGEDYNLGFCYDHGWFLSVDFQLYVITPLLLVPLYYASKKNRWMPHLWMFLWVCSSFCLPLGLFYTHPDYPSRDGPGTLFGEDLNNGNYGFELAIKPFMRYGSYVCGVWAGYFLHKHRTKKLRLPTWLVAFAWCAILVTFNSILYGNAEWFVLKGDDIAKVKFPSRDQSIWFTVLNRPAWGAALSAMIILCHHGYGGPANAFLSFKGFVAPSRLTYGCYLMHVPLMFWYWYTRITPFTIDHTTKILDFFGHLGVTMCVSFVLSMMFEFPILKLEKIWLFPKSSKSSPGDKNVGNVNNEPSQTKPKPA